MMDFSFPKKERVCGKKSISALLDKGRWGSTASLRFCCLTPTGEDVNRVMVSVPKKHFKRAVKRNLLKRRMRESYRTRKAILATPGHDIMLVYTSREIQPFSTISAEVESILDQINAWK